MGLFRTLWRARNTALLGVALVSALLVVQEAEGAFRRIRRARQQPILQQPIRVAQPRCGNCLTRTSLQSLGAQPGAVSNSTFRNGIIDSRFRSRLREVQGASNLLTDGRNLFERNLVPVRGGVHLEEVRQLFIDGAGRLLNSRSPVTRTQLRDFYLKNFEKFNGNARVLVSRFLAANGAGDAFLGNLRVAIKGGVLPPGVKITDPRYERYSAETVNAAALAFALNLISNRTQPIRVLPKDAGANGVITTNLLGAVDPAGMARLLNDNPYDCDRRGVARADWLVTRILDPDIYYQMTGLSANQDEFADQVGFVDDKKAQRGSLLLMAGSRTKPETIVGRNPQRVLQWQSRKDINGREIAGFDGRRRYCFRSHDFVENPVPGSEEASRDVFRSGVNFTADAGEWICQRANGFPIYYLSAEANRARANNAPAEIALDAGNPVSVADRCIRCHMNGFHGGRLQDIRQGENTKPYTDHFARIQPSLGQEFFSANAKFNEDGTEVSNPATLGFNEGRDYPAAARHASAIQDNAFKESGAYLLDFKWEEERKKNKYVRARALPVVYDLAQEYRKDLSVERQAQELGTTVQEVQRVFGNKAVSRNEFANSYCIRVSRVRRGGFIPDQRNPAAPPETPHNGNAEDALKAGVSTDSSTPRRSSEE